MEKFKHEEQFLKLITVKNGRSLDTGTLLNAFLIKF
jgi:hypothetical protein